MIIGGYKDQLEIGAQVILYDKQGDNPKRECPARVMREATREEYVQQQKERGYFEFEVGHPWSIVNTAKYFYLLSID